jgi:hypothetical protein
MRTVYVALLAALSMATAHGQQPTSITLSCSGTSKLMTAAADAKPDPVANAGMIVDFQERTVTFASYCVPIERADSTMVLFHGKLAMSYTGAKPKPVTVNGSVDRVTGAANMTFLYEQVGSEAVWDLGCRPASRLF